MKIYSISSSAMMKRIAFTITLAIICCCGISEHAAHAHPNVGLSAEDENHAIQAQQAGLAGDTSQIPAITALLRQPVQPALHETALMALARLGAASALPLFDALIQNKDNPDVAAFAVAARARLAAESAAQSFSPGPSQAANKVTRFYQELNLSPQDLNAAVANYQQNSRQRPAISLPFATSVGEEAVVQLADMIYHDGSENYASLPGVSAVNFAADPPSALKMRLASLSKEERIATMIFDLTHKISPVWTPLDNDEVQLLTDEGQPASRAAAAQLVVMEQNRQSYKSTAFGAMFSVIANVGDRDQAPLVKHFKADPDPIVAEYADRLYDSIAKGHESRVVHGY